MPPLPEVALPSPAPSRDDWRDIFLLLDMALELDPVARPAWLDSLGPEHARLLPKLSELLREQAVLDGSGFLQSAPAFAVLDAAHAVPPELAPQSLVGPYRLLREIGQGGMASVWLAERADGLLERRVALKLPHVSWGSGSFAERMARERSILASLTHPNIARLYDVGTAADGRPFLAMEVIDGQPIDTYAATRGLGVRQRVELIVQVARAVAHAHAQLVVHRDLKPSNILVDAQGRAHLLDFGIAKLIDPAQDGIAEGTQATLMLGRALTPDYASPEQIRGDPLGTASDVYSLGVVAFELFAGARPYRFKPGLGAAALVESVGRVAVPAASKVASDEAVRRELRGDLDAILAKALAHASTDRYATVDALAEDLERHLRGEPVRVRAASRSYRVDRWVRRHKVESAITLALLLALVGGAYAQVLVVLGLGAGALAALWQRNRAVRQAELAREALARGEQVKDFIASIFTQAVPQAGRGGAVAAADLLRAAARRVESDIGGQPAVAAELAVLIGQSFVKLDELPDAMAWCPKAAALASRELGATHRLSLQARLAWAEAANASGELAVSEPLMPALIRDLRALQPGAPALLARALQAGAYADTKRGHETQAMAALHEAVELTERALGAASEAALDARSDLSNTLAFFGRFAEVVPAIEPALAPAREAFGAQRPHPMLAQIELRLAEAFMVSDRPRQAAALLPQVLADQRSLDAGDSHRVRVVMTMHGMALQLGGHLEAARAVLTESAELHRRQTGGINHEAAQSEGWLARNAALRGDASALQAHVDRAEVIMRGQAENEPQRQSRAAERAMLAVLRGETDTALASIAAFLAESNAVVPALRVLMLRYRALALRVAGRFGEALAAAGQAQAEAAAGREGFQVRALEHGLVLAEAARCHMAAGDVAAAAQRWRAALSVWEAGQVDGAEVRRPVQAELAALAALSSP